MENRFEYIENEHLRIGDIVEITYDWSQHDNPVGKLRIVKDIDRKDNCVQIEDNRSEESWYSMNYVRGIINKGNEELAEGDTVVLVTISDDSYYCIGDEEHQSLEGSEIKFSHYSASNNICGYKKLANGKYDNEIVCWKYDDVVALKSREDDVFNHYDKTLLDELAKGEDYSAKMSNLCEDISVASAVDAQAGICASALGYIPHDLGPSQELQDEFNKIREEISEKFAEHRDAMLDAMIYGTGVLEHHIDKEHKITATHIEMMRLLNDESINRVIPYYGRGGGKSLYGQSLIETYLKKQAEKEKTMPHEIQIKVDGKEININECCEDMVEEVQTDLEVAPKWITIWYDIDGQAVMQEMNMSPKQARAELQANPELIGYTFRSYKVADSGTTNIPLKKLDV